MIGMAEGVMITIEGGRGMHGPGPVAKALLLTAKGTPLPKQTVTTAAGLHPTNPVWMASAVLGEGYTAFLSSIIEVNDMIGIKI